MAAYESTFDLGGLSGRIKVSEAPNRVGQITFSVDPPSEGAPSFFVTINDWQAAQLASLLLQASLARRHADVRIIVSEQK